MATSSETLSLDISEYSASESDRMCNYCRFTGAKFQCNDCNTMYCSEECQRYDWDQHKEFCVIMPRLSSIDSKIIKVVNKSSFVVPEHTNRARAFIRRQILLEKDDFSELDVTRVPFCVLKNEDTVRIIHVHNPYLIFLRSVDNEYNYSDMQDELNKLSHNKYRKNNKFMIHEFILVKTKCDSNNFYRGYIMDVNKDNTMITVFFVDIGYNSDINRELCYQLPFSFNLDKIPGFITPVKIDVFDPFERSPEEVFKIHKLLFDMQCDYIDLIVKGRQIIQPFDEIKLEDDRNTEINFKLLPEDSYASLPKKVVSTQDAEIILLGRLENSENHPKYACLLPADRNSFKKYDRKIQQYCENDNNTPYTPKVGELCLISLIEFGTKKIWYRAVYLKDICKSEGKFFAIDYGFSDHVNKLNIRKLPLHLRYPVLVFASTFTTFYTKNTRLFVRSINFLEKGEFYNEHAIRVY